MRAIVIVCLVMLGGCGPIANGTYFECSELACSSGHCCDCDCDMTKTGTDKMICTAHSRDDCQEQCVSYC